MIPCPLSASSSANDLLQRVCKTGRKFLSLCHLTYIFLCSHFFLLFSSAQTLQYLSIDFHIQAKLLATANIPSLWSGICLPLHFHWCDSYFYVHAPVRLMLSFPEIIVQFHIYLWYIFFLCWTLFICHLCFINSQLFFESKSICQRASSAPQDGVRCPFYLHLQHSLVLTYNYILVTIP